MTETPDDRATQQWHLLQALESVAPADAVGVACAVLQHQAERDPQMVRRALNARIIREGFTGRSLLDYLTAAAR